MNDMTLHVEVVNDMTAFEKEKLADELTVLMQNQSARIEVTQERGFPYLWRVLTGKQGKLQSQISLDQTQINQIMRTLLMQLWQKQTEQSNDINALIKRLSYLEKMIMLHSMYLLRLDQEVTGLGGTPMDVSPLRQHLNEMEQEKQVLSTRTGSQSAPEQEGPSGIGTHELIVELARKTIRSGVVFEDFISTTKFSKINAELWVMNAGVFWTTVFRVDGWEIQRFDNDKNHYRILDPRKIRRAWTDNPYELIQILQNYRQLLAMRESLH